MQCPAKRGKLHGEVESACLCVILKAGKGEQYFYGALPHSMLMPSLYVVLLLVNMLYSFVHRTENVSSTVKPLRIPLMKVQAGPGLCGTSPL